MKKKNLKLPATNCQLPNKCFTLLEMFVIVSILAIIFGIFCGKCNNQAINYPECNLCPENRTVEIKENIEIISKSVNIGKVEKQDWLELNCYNPHLAFSYFSTPTSTLDCWKDFEIKRIYYTEK